jgi:hypothetical protein
MQSFLKSQINCTVPFFFDEERITSTYTTQNFTFLWWRPSVYSSHTISLTTHTRTLFFVDAEISHRHSFSHNNYIRRKGILFSVRIQVQYRKSVKNVTFSSTNHDLVLKKEHFFQIKKIFDLKKRTFLAALWYSTWICSFFVFLF